MTKARGSQNQDKPFVFKSKTGAVIRIPSKVVYDPDMDAVANFQRARTAAEADPERELDMAIAMLEMVKSGFPKNIADTIKLKSSELGDFMKGYFEHTGTDIPKS